MSWDVENERFDGIVENGIGLTGLNDGINVPMHAFEMKWSVDKESMRRSMKMMQKGIIVDMEAVHPGRLTFTIPCAAISGCEMCTKFRSVLKGHDSFIEFQK